MAAVGRACSCLYCIISPFLYIFPFQPVARLSNKRCLGWLVCVSSSGGLQVLFLSSGQSHGYSYIFDKYQVIILYQLQKLHSIYDPVFMHKLRHLAHFFFLLPDPQNYL